MSNLMYQYKKNAGNLGLGAWVVYDEEPHREPIACFGSEQACIDFIRDDAERFAAVWDEWEEERMQMGYM